MHRLPLGKWSCDASHVRRPNFFLYENNSKGVILTLPFEAHTIQVVITRKGFLNYFKVAGVDDETLRAWAQRNILPLSQIAWFAYDQGRYRERMVVQKMRQRPVQAARNRYRQVRRMGFYLTGPRVEPDRAIDEKRRA